MHSQQLYMLLGAVVLIVIVLYMCKKRHVSEHFLVKKSFPNGGYQDWGMYAPNTDPLGTAYESSNPDADSYPYGENQDNSEQGQGIIYGASGPELWF
jgi:hypothetical protein